MVTKTAVNFWIDLVSLLVMIGLIATGGLIHWVLPAGSGHWASLFGLDRHDYGRVHFYLAMAAVALLALHVVLHWSWVCCVVGRACGHPSPSRRAQVAWGLGLLLGIALLLGGGLYLASSAVQRTRGEHAGHRWAADNPAAAPAAAPTERGAPEPVANTAPERVADPGAEPGLAGRRDHGGEHHAYCPAGAAINGRISLQEAARLCGAGVEELLRHLSLPAGIDPQEKLGRLRRGYGLDMEALRRFACRGTTR